MRLLLAAFLLLASCIGAAAQGCGPSNPNCIVPTAPAGTSDNRAASTAFVQSSASGSAVKGPASSTVGDVPTYNNTLGTLIADPTTISANAQDFYFGTGRPSCDIRAKGAKQDGVTNDAAAITSCNTTLTAIGGGVIYVPPSSNVTCVESQVTISASVSVLGAQIGASNLSSCGAGNTILKLDGSNAGLSNITLLGPGADGEAGFSATNPTLVVSANAVDCVMWNVQVQGGTHALEYNSGECHIHVLFASNSYGSSILHFTAANGHTAAGFFFDVKPDETNYPQGTTPAQATTFAAWAATTSYTAGVVVSVTCQDSNSYFFQAMTSGTSGGAFPACKNRGQTITDSGVTWQLAFPNTYCHWQFDSNTSEVYVDRADTGGGTSGVCLTNNTGGGTAPSSIHILNGNGGTGYSANFLATYGSDIELVNFKTSGCIAVGCANILFGANATGSSTIVGGQSTGSPYGVRILAGSGYTVVGSILTSNTVAAVSVENAASIVTATANDTNGSAYGMQALNTSADIVWTGNTGCVSGTTTACTNVTSSGANIITSPNDDGIAYAIKIGGTIFSPTTNATCVLFSSAGTTINCNTNLSTNGTGTLNVGLPGTSVGKVAFGNATSGTITVATPTGALGTVQNTLQAVADTFVYKATADTLTNKTLTSPAINTATISGGTIDNAAIGGTTPAAGKFTSLNASGQITSTAGLPTIASGACGATTNGAVVSGSTNQSGQITIGSAATTTCTISWSATLATAPNACVFFPMNAAAAATGTTVARVGAPSTTQVVLTGSALANANYAYLCL